MGSSILKSVAVVLAAFLVVTTTVRGQSCVGDLVKVQACAPLVLPGATNATPNSECCSAIQSIKSDCLCNALRAATTLPSICNLPPVSCGISA